MKKKKRLFFLIVAFSVFNFYMFSDLAMAHKESWVVEKSIGKTTNQLQQAQAQLNVKQAQYSVNQKQIVTTKVVISKTQKEIKDKELKIKKLNQQIDLNKKVLESYIQKMSFESSRNPVVSFTMAGNFLNTFSGNFDQMINIKEKILNTMDQIKKDKNVLANTKNQLDEKKKEHEKLLAQKQAKKNEIAVDINETNLTIAQLQAKLNKLRSRLSSFLGEDFSMDDVIDAVKLADKKTGVRKEFLFAILDKESDLGRFTGGCTYKNTRIRDKNPDDKSAFKKICEDLGYNYKKMKVSCALSYGYGGAMGVAQFMPTTWNKYKSGISSRTGNKPANPWDLEDGVMGMALYLKDKGGDKKSREHTAAAAYYCGSRLERAICQNYANSVINWSKGYDDYF